MSDGNFCRFCGDPALIDQIATLQSRLTASEEAARWIPVKERLPDESDEILIWGEGEHWHASFVGGDFCELTTDYQITGVTHWMPLPTPPGC